MNKLDELIKELQGISDMIGDIGEVIEDLEEIEDKLHSVVCDNIYSCSLCSLYSLDPCPISHLREQIERMEGLTND